MGTTASSAATAPSAASLTLPEGVDPEAVKATFDKGVLAVTVPKPEQQAPRKVQITVGGASAGEPEAIEGSESSSRGAGRRVSRRRRERRSRHPM